MEKSRNGTISIKKHINEVSRKNRNTTIIKKYLNKLMRNIKEL